MLDFIKKILRFGLLAFAGILILYPVYQILILSFRPSSDAAAYVSTLEDSAIRFVRTYLLPEKVSFAQYQSLVSGGMMQSFRNTILYTGSVLVLQFPIAFCMGYCFAKKQFKGKNRLFFLYIAATVMPFQVTLVPMFSLLNQLKLYDTYFAIILPGIFSPLGTFLFRQFISQVPDEVLEAASVDGAGTLKLFRSIVFPMIKPGILLYFLFTAASWWAAVEPYLAFIRSEGKQPASILLRRMMQNDPAAIFAPSMLYILPMLLIYGITVFAARKEGDFLKFQ